MDTHDTLIERIKKILWYIPDPIEIRNRLITEGYTDDDIFLCYTAAKRLNDQHKADIETAVSSVVIEPNVVYEFGCSHPDYEEKGGQYLCKLCKQPISKWSVWDVRDIKAELDIA